MFDEKDTFSSDDKHLPHLPPPYPNEVPQAGPASAPQQPPHFACLLLSRMDRIRLLNFPQPITAIVGEAVKRSWPSGIQKEGKYDGGGYEWKLSGHPWSGQGHEAISARRLIIHVLAALSAAGWHLFTAIDLSKKGWDKDTLIFRQGPAIQRHFFSVSFNESDKVRLIDPPAGPVVVDAFKKACQTWSFGVQEFREKEPQVFQYKLRGRPWWTSDGGEVNAARLLACTILSMLEMAGFQLVGSIDMSVGQGEGQGDLDTWFFATKL